MKNLSFYVLVFFSLTTRIFAQSLDCNSQLIEDSHLKDFNYCGQYENFTLLKSSSSPYTYSNSPLYTIKLKVHVIQFSQSDPKNYTPSDISDILTTIGYVNSFYSNIQLPTRPVLSPSLEETDSRIRFSCNASDVDFIVDPIGWDRYVDQTSTSLISINSIVNNQTIIINGQVPFVTPNCVEILNSIYNNGVYRISTSTYNSSTNKTQIVFESGFTLPNLSDLSGQLRFHKDTDKNFDNHNYVYHNNNDKNAIHIYLTSSSSFCYQVRFGGVSSPYWLNLTTPNAQSGSLTGDDAWSFAQLLAHEIGHCLGLIHTDTPQFDDLPSADDFSDVICNSTTNSNNIMGYNLCRNYLSPKQIATIRTLLNCQYIINDLNGSEINRSSISKNKGEMVIDTRNYNDGVYIISIVNNGVKMQERKLIVKNK